MCQIISIIALLLSSAAFGADSFFLGIGHEDGQDAQGKKIEGQFGRIVVSPDGEKWESVFRGGPVTDNFNHARNNLVRCATYGNGVFVASGNSGMFHSKDGREWQLGNAPYGTMSVAYGNDMFVAPTAFEILTSKDGINWTKKSPKITGPSGFKDGPGHIRKIVFGNGVFVCTGEQRLSVTRDGETWLHHETLLEDKRPGQQSFIAFGAGRFLWCREKLPLITSTDGIKWENVDLPDGGKGSSLLWTGSEFLMSGKESIYSSPDGLKWTQKPAPRLYHFHCVGKNLLLVNATWNTQAIRLSPDMGATWREAKVGAQLRQIYFFDGKQILGHNGG